MPIKLHVPEENKAEHVPLRLGLRVHGYERPQRDKEAQMFIVLICTSLWGLFWIQFLIGCLSNLPALYWLSGGLWYPPPLEYYSENIGPFPWSLACTFAVLSLFASVMGLLGAWLWTVGVYGKWRMRFAVLIFCFIATGWSIAGLKAEYGVGDGLRKQIAREREIWQWVATEADLEETWKYRELEMQHHRESIERLQNLLEEWESKRR